jgi:cytidylate kinase
VEKNPRSVQRLVEEQIQRWQAEQTRRSSHKMKAAAPPPPIVTISREAGARGTEIGRVVAKELGFTFWDQELVQRIAEQTGAGEALLRNVDERARGVIEDFISAMVLGISITEREYFSELVRVVHAIARHGGSVVIGRGAHYVLSADEALRVRIVSPLEERVRYMADSRKLSDKEARDLVERLDRERAEFMRHHYRREIEDFTAYDMILNWATIPFERVPSIVVAAYRAKFGDTAPPT